MPDQPTYSPSFNADRDTLVLKSKEGILFRVDRDKLVAVSPAFEAILGMKPESSRKDEPIVVAESTVVLSAFLRLALRMSPADVLAITPFKTMMEVLEALNKYDVEVSSTLFCDQLFIKFVSSEPVKVWSVCAKAGHEGLARACVPYFAEVVDTDGKRAKYVLDRGPETIQGFPLSPADIPVEDLDGVPGVSLQYLLRCYDKVALKGETWKSAGINKDV